VTLRATERRPALTFLLDAFGRDPRGGRLRKPPNACRCGEGASVELGSVLAPIALTKPYA
jgi:hypothetical protein